MDNIETLKCSNCKQEKDRLCFSKNCNHARGFSYVCKECMRAYYASRPKRSYLQIRAMQVKQDYGISLAQVEAMKVAQQNKCEICSKEFTKTPNVDHCHRTGKVRGLLCSRCNTLIAGPDDPVWLEKALTYKEKYGPLE